MPQSWATSFRLVAGRLRFSCSGRSLDRCLSLGVVCLALRGPPFTSCLERKTDENRSADCTLSAWPRLSCIWAEWFPAFHSHAASASGPCRPILDCALCVTFRFCSLGGSTRGRPTAARESLRAARPGPSWLCDREHPFLSSAHG